MREQVLVLPPSVESRNTNLSKKEEALHNPSKESRTWAVSDGKNAEHVREFSLIERDRMEVKHAELASAENMQPKNTTEALAEPFKGACADVEQAKAYAEGALGLETSRNSPPSNGEGAPFLQWGLRKRSRCSRGDTHYAGPLGDNPNSKPGSPVDESSVLFRKTVRVQADRATVVQPNTSSYVFKGSLKVKNGVVAKGEHLWSEEKHNAKVLKGGPSDVKQGIKGSPLRGGKRADPSTHKEDQLLQQIKTCAPNSPPKTLCVAPPPGKKNSFNELVWPKLVIGLSRKEKEEDFLILRGTKLPQRPKRRPKVVERALHYCSPGTWLAEISPLKYDVREKKRARKRPRGLKAMESLDSDSD